MQFDHFLFGGRDLATMSSDFERQTQVKPLFGGHHPGLGTHNALAKLGEGCYFELLAVDPAQTQGAMGDYLRTFEAPRLFAYMLRAADLERLQAVLAEHGIASDLNASSRTKPDGEVLRWRLLMPRFDNPWGHYVPKFIEWDNCTHPSAASPAGCELVSFELTHTRHDALAGLLRALGAPVAVHPGAQDAMRLSLRTPAGPVLIEGR